MLQSLRTGSKSPLMKVFLVFLAGGFAIWGIGDVSTGFFGPGDKAIKLALNPYQPLKSLKNLILLEELNITVFLREMHYNLVY